MRSGWLGFALLAVGCDMHPGTGSRGPSVSESKDTAIGRAGAADVIAAFGAHPNAALQAYVNRVGQAVAEAGQSGASWEFTVVEDASANAFALPGGFIFVTRGLLARLGSEAELAAVLGHEIAHVTSRHAARRSRREQLAPIGLTGGTAVSPVIARLAPINTAGEDLLHLQYGRDDETEADRLGFGYAVAQGWDARRMRGLFAMLQRDAFLRGIGQFPSWQATHPDPGDRIRALDQLVRASDADFSDLHVGVTEYLTEIDGLVYGEDPRDGFFQGSLFVQPELAYLIRFPEGWALHNTSQAVTAVSPDGAGVLELRGVFGTVAEAARDFVDQEGLTAGPLEHSRIHGLEALHATFEAQADDGPVIQGTATFVRYGDTTWRIVGFAVPELFTAVAEAFAQTAQSFAPLEDAAALAMQPRRIRITRSPHAMTLGEFTTEFPSSISLEELAALNGLGSTSTLSAGQLVKRVVGSRPSQTVVRR